MTNGEMVWTILGAMAGQTGLLLIVLNAKLATVGAKIDGLSVRLGNVETRIDRLDTRLDKLTDQVHQDLTTHVQVMHPMPPTPPANSGH